MKTYSLDTVYEAETDTIVAYVEADEEVKVELHMSFVSESIQIELPNSAIEDFAAVNVMHLAAIIMSALADATTGETEIPMHLDEAITIQL